MGFAPPASSGSRVPEAGVSAIAAAAETGSQVERAATSDAGAGGAGDDSGDVVVVLAVGGDGAGRSSDRALSALTNGFDRAQGLGREVDAAPPALEAAVEVPVTGCSAETAGRAHNPVAPL